MLLKLLRREKKTYIMEPFHVPLALISFTRQQSALELSRLKESRKSLVSAPPQWAGTAAMELFRPPAMWADQVRIRGGGVLSAGSLSPLRLTVIGDHTVQTCLGAKANAVGANEPCENCTHWLGMAPYTFSRVLNWKSVVFRLLHLWHLRSFAFACNFWLFNFTAWLTKKIKKT